MVGGSGKIPRHVANEFRRHVRSTKNVSPSHQSEADSKLKTLLGCTAFIGLTASLPFLAMQWIGPLNERDEALSAAQIRRGAFNNSGSRDVGKDPNWDFKHGRRRSDEEYERMFKMDNPSEIDHGDQYVESTNTRRSRW